MGFKKKARDLRSIEQEIVRPLEGQARRSEAGRHLDGLVQGKPRHEPKLGCDRRLAGIHEQEARVEVAGRRRPLPAVASPTGPLFGGYDPEPSRIAGSGRREGVVVG
jgi:hypothetical protein